MLTVLQEAQDRLRTQIAISACSHAWPSARQYQALTGCCVNELTNQPSWPSPKGDRKAAVKDAGGKVPCDEAERAFTKDGMAEHGEDGERLKKKGRNA